MTNLCFENCQSKYNEKKLTLHVNGCLLPHNSAIHKQTTSEKLRAFTNYHHERSCSMLYSAPHLWIPCGWRPRTGRTQFFVPYETQHCVKIQHMATIHFKRRSSFQRPLCKSRNQNEPRSPKIQFFCETVGVM